MTLPPIRRSVVVEATPERAYAAWTEEIGQWWPLATHSVFEHDNTIAFVGEDLVETAADGSRTVWGTVLEADPPRLLKFSWHPGNDDDRGTVELRFVPLGRARTLVTLEHSGWEYYPQPSVVREDYRVGWIPVLADYRGTFGRADSATDADEVWLVLEHTPGMATGPAGVFAHPLFAEHRRFLDELATAGVLVAAGALPDSPGHGQAIIRVPAAETAEYVARAQQDGAVVGDLLLLNVRPWQVSQLG